MYSYKLLIENHKSKLEFFLKKYQTIIIRGPTGCGKSTFVPLLLKDFNVAIIEPRRIAVTSLFNTLKTQIQNIGYKMRFNKELPKDQESKKMMIFTDGSFLADLDLDYDYIIIDEVHERSIRTDILLSILKERFKNKLVLMSATLEIEKLENFFNAKVFNIPGKSHSLEVHYLEKPTSDYIVEAYLTIKKIVKDDLLRIKKGIEVDSRNDILVFLPGSEDINDLYKLLMKIASVKPCKIYSAMSDFEQNKIYEESNIRKVILSTNICETSLTIPNIKYVIDSGLYKNKIFNGINYLGIQCITKESEIQRMGRCNRVGPGICYKLYTKETVFSDYTPEIMRSDLTTVILQMNSLNLNILKSNFIDSPPLKSVSSALSFLLSKNCISAHFGKEKMEFDPLSNSLKIIKNSESSKNVDSQRNLEISFKITSYGRRIAGHPFDVHLAHFYEQMVEAKLGYFGSCIVSLICLENYNFLTGKDSSDILSLIELIEAYKAENDKNKFCTEKNIPVKGMERAYKIFKTLNKSKTQSDLEIVESIFSRCFSHNLCIRQPDGTYVMQRNKQQIFIHPSSGFFKKNVKKIVVVDIFYTTKMYARIAGRFFN